MTALVPWQSAIANSERKFNEISVEVNNEVSFKVESMFALQAITANSYLMDIANNNPDSLRDAIINIASVGLSLNPVTQYAYLVPRNGRACLDISYKGMIKLATDSGSMLWVRADLVYSDDTFTYKGPAEKPEHQAQPFGDRGEFVGVYCMAKTNTGDFLVEVMNAAEVHQVRDASKQWQNSHSGPWKEWFGEMVKKSIIKRASKTWPRTKCERLAHAVDVLNEDYVVDIPQAKEQVPAAATLESLIDELEKFTLPGSTEEELDQWLKENKQRIESLPDEYEQKRLNNYVENEVRDLLQERQKPKRPTTIECPNGFEVDLKDCTLCPQMETCTTYQTEQNNAE